MDHRTGSRLAALVRERKPVSLIGDDSGTCLSPWQRSAVILIQLNCLYIISGHLCCRGRNFEEGHCTDKQRRVGHVSLLSLQRGRGHPAGKLSTDTHDNANVRGGESTVVTITGRYAVNSPVVGPINLYLCMNWAVCMNTSVLELQYFRMGGA